MICWGHWRTINGKRVCIKDPLSKPLIFLTFALIASAIAGGTAVGAAPVGGATAEVTVTQSLSVRITNSKKAARQGRHSEAWLRMGLRSVSRQVRHDPGCAAHSFGQVRKCLLAEPCRGLQRSLFKISDNKGRTIVVSVAWVRMPSTVSARHLKRLVDKPGTGNISPIADDALVGVRFTGKHYASRRTGSVVVIAEAAAGSGQPGAAVLNGLAEVAAEFPS